MIKAIVMNCHLRIFRLVHQKNIPNVFRLMVPRWRRPQDTFRTNLTPKLRYLSSEASKSCSKEDVDKSIRSVFFGGVLRGTTEEMMLDYFSKFGDVEDVRLVKSFHGVSKNYGFVCFKSSNVAEEVLSKEHLLRGKKMNVGRCTKNRMVYVGGLPSHMTESTLQKYFSKFGRVESLRFIDNHTLHSHSGYAVITFSSIEEASKAVLEEKQTIEDSNVKVKLSKGYSDDQTIAAEITKSKKIVVEWLPYETITVEELRDYFETFGDLEGIDLLIDIKRKTCGAIVVFAELNGVLNTLAQEHHEIDGCVVNLVRKKDTFKYSPREKTLYLENLAPQTTEQSLWDYFRSYGAIAKAKVIQDQNTGLRFGLVKFRKPKTLSSFLNISRHIIDDCEVKARRRGITFSSKSDLDIERSYLDNLTDS